MSSMQASAHRAGVTVIDPSNSFIRCDACGKVWGALIQHGGHYHRGWRACPEGCNEDRLGNRRSPAQQEAERS
jgi:hypothetical protein